MSRARYDSEEGDFTHEKMLLIRKGEKLFYHLLQDLLLCSNGDIQCNKSCRLYAYGWMKSGIGHKILIRLPRVPYLNHIPIAVE